jgi:cell division protease FtsH
MQTRTAAVCLAGLAAAALPSADAFAGAPAAGLKLRGARAATGAPLAMRASAGGDGAQVRKQMAAVLASALLAAPIGHVGPAFAADAMEAPAPAPAAEKTSSNGVQNWRYSEFMSAVEEDNVEKATFSADGKRVLVVDVDGNRYKLDALPNDPTLLDTLTKHKVDVTVLPPQQAAAAGGGSLVSSLLFPALLFGGLFLLSQRGQGGEGGGFGGMPGGPGNPMQMGQTQAKVQMQPDTGVTFEDVVGVDQAKIELEEVVQFLKEQDRFTELGARIPRGLILEGPPGTGKTLLARAVAGEAGVPFFSVSGSEFVEMFVGVGASRVRDLFAQAKKNAPCIIFIDEIDAVGRQRGGGQGGGNDEREQTLNQILTEMDGFEGNPGIIVIAATNRADVLDSALLRPGRFDRRIMVDNPDFSGRVAILGVHARGKPLEDDVDLESIARRTPGFSGASLANLMNEAAIFAARKDKVKIGNEQISDALDRVTLGPEKKNAEISMQKRELVAYHEAGHAVVGALIPDYDQVAKITITPRGGAGGLTFFAPNEDRTDSGLYSRQYLESMMAVALGGRIAEEIIFGEDEITTGASNDLERVSSTAKRMVMEFGMSEKIGQVALAGGQGGQQQPMSAETKVLIDAEVSRLVQGAYTRAKQLLLDNRESLDKLAVMLCEKETVTAEEFAQILTDSTVSISDYKVYS